MRIMKRPKFSWKYALAVTGLVVLAILVMDFNNRMAALRHLTQQRELVAGQLQRLQATQAALQTQIAYATSEGAVVDWAYSEGNLVRPGDNPVVPISPPGGTPVPTSTPAMVTLKVSNLQMWLWLFFDLEGQALTTSP